VDAREQLIDEPLSAAVRVRGPLAAADVQHLVGIRAGRDDRAIPVDVYPYPAPLFVVAVDLADEAVQIDHQRPVSGPGARVPRSGQGDVEHAVELADVPEGSR